MRVQLSDVNFVRLVILICSILDAITLIFRHYSKSKWLNEDLPNEMLQNLYTHNMYDWEQDYKTGMMFKMRKWFRASLWLEVLALMVCPVPYWDRYFSIEVLNTTDKTTKIATWYLISDLILCFMFIRIFFVVRAVFNYNLYTDLYSQKLCKSFGFTANIRFAYKCILKENPMWTVFMTLIISVGCLGFVLRVFEAPYFLTIGQLDFNSFFQSCYLVVITMTTVGFGDISPATVFGKAVILLTAMWGTFLIGLLILSVGAVFNLKPNERMSSQQLLQTKMAARAITASMRYFLYKQKYLDNKLTKDKDGNVIVSPANENTIEDRVELKDLNQCRKEMLTALANFKQHSKLLHELNDTEKQRYYENVRFIKNSVLDLADAFDHMNMIQNK
jgi:hypothetical protein